jgi:FHA domain
VPDIRYGTSRDSLWHAMVSSTCVLVVDRALTEDRVRDIWATVTGGSGVQAVLDALTRGGISSTPSFALAVLPAGFGVAPTAITVIVRGALGVTVTSRGESAQIRGEGVSTWVERLVPDATALRIGSGVDAGHATGESYVLNDGSAPVNWLTVGTALPSESSVLPPRVQTPTIVEASPVDNVVDPGVTISDPTLLSADEPDGTEDGYDFLFGETVVRTVEGAAVRENHSDNPIAAGDHDGRTAVGLTAAERRAARAARQKPAAPVAPAAPAFALTFSTGEREPLDSTVIIGRAPSASKVSATSVPRLVTVGGPDQDISRNHVQVNVEGGTVMVTDLHSRNGTMITLPGRPPQQLRGGQPTAVIGGAVVDLGSGVTFTVGDN